MDTLFVKMLLLSLTYCLQMTILSFCGDTKNEAQTIKSIMQAYEEASR